MKLSIQPFSALPLSPDCTLRTDQELVARTGRVTVIAGDSGCGKSSLLEMLAGYRSTRTPTGPVSMSLYPDANGTPVCLRDFVAAVPSRIAYLPQQTVLRPFLTPRGLLSSWIGLLSAAYPKDHPVPTEARAVQADLTQKLFDPSERDLLFGRGSTRLSQVLSGGQKRRLDVILTMTTPAEIILLDEPDTGLDARRRGCLYDALTRFARDHHRIVIVVSHHADCGIAHQDVDTWRLVPASASETRIVQNASDASGAPTALACHLPPEDLHDRRCLQTWLYFKLRVAGVLGNRLQAAVWLLLIPVALLLLIQCAVYVDPQTSSAASAKMKLLFFFAVTCFWLGALQAGGFWADEHLWFRRECLQGVSSVSYILGFVLSAFSVASVQSAAAALVLTWPHSQLSSSFWRIFLCGCWSAVNGILTGLLLGSILYWCYWWKSRHRRFTVAPDPTTAQLCVLLITLVCIVFSYPVIGDAPYENIRLESGGVTVSDAPGYPDRIAIVQTVWQHRADTPHARPILVAEIPWLSQGPFHALWFQGEKALGQDASYRPSAAEEIIWNSALLLVLLMLGALSAALACRLKRYAS